VQKVLKNLHFSPLKRSVCKVEAKVSVADGQIWANKKLLNTQVLCIRIGKMPGIGKPTHYKCQEYKGFDSFERLCFEKRTPG
jgi:hypothetical protein